MSLVNKLDSLGEELKFSGDAMSLGCSKSKSLLTLFGRTGDVLKNEKSGSVLTTSLLMVSVDSLIINKI